MYLGELLEIVEQIFRRDTTKPSIVISLLDSKSKKYYGSVVRYMKNNKKKVVINTYEYNNPELVLENLIWDLRPLYPKNRKLNKLAFKLQENYGNIIK